jgi:hypothetical protein
VGFLLSGWWTRWVCEPRTARRENDPTLPFELQPTGVFPPAIEGLNQALLRRRLSFRLRTPEERTWMHLGHACDCEVLADTTDSALDAYAVIRRVEGPRGTEDHLVDAACDPGQFPRLAAGLRDLVAERRAPLFVSVFGDGFASALREAGFRQLRPRWNLRWRWRDPRQRSSTFVRRDAWFLLPADAVLDYSL